MPIDASGEIILVFNRKAEFATHPDALLGTAWRLVSIDGDSLGGDARTAVSPISCRFASSITAEGVSSMIFWWRR